MKTGDRLIELGGGLTLSLIATRSIEQWRRVHGIVRDEEMQRLHDFYAPDEFEAGRKCQRWLNERNTPAVPTLAATQALYERQREMLGQMLTEAKAQVTALHEQMLANASTLNSQDLWTVWKRASVSDGVIITLGLAAGRENARQLAEEFANYYLPDGWEWGRENRIYHKDASADQLVPMGIDLADHVLRVRLNRTEASDEQPTR